MNIIKKGNGVFIHKHILENPQLNLFDKFILAQITTYLNWAKEKKGLDYIDIHDQAFIGDCNNEYKKQKIKISKSLKKLKELGYVCEIKKFKKKGGDTRLWKRYSLVKQTGYVYIFKIMQDEIPIAYKLGKSKNPVKRMTNQFRNIPLFCEVHAIYSMIDYSKAEFELKNKYKHLNLKHKIDTKGTEFYGFNRKDLEDIDIYLIRKYNADRFFTDYYENTDKEYQYVDVFSELSIDKQKKLYQAGLKEVHNILLLN